MRRADEAAPIGRQEPIRRPVERGSDVRTGIFIHIDLIALADHDKTGESAIRARKSFSAVLRDIGDPAQRSHLR
jgi:hypothetical protein